MQNVKHNPIVRLLPSFTDVAFLMPLVFLFSRLDGVAGMLGDGDTGWHIRAGEWMLQHGRVPAEDIFSFTMPGRPWYAWEWLWDVAFAWLHLNWGMGAVVFASMTLICVTFALLFRLVHRMSGHVLVAIGLTVLAAATTTIHWLARPHLFTMLFLVIFLDVIHRARQGRLLLLACLPVLTIPWANLHGGFLAGILLLLAYGAGDVVSAVVAAGGPERADRFRTGRLFLLTAATCGAVSLINPYGYQLHLHIWDYLRDPEMTRSIIEFQATNFQDGRARFLEVLLIGGFGAAVWYGRQRRFAEIFALAGWGHLAVVVVRNGPLFAIVAAVLIAPALTAWIEALKTAPVAGWARGVARTVSELGEEFGPMERIRRLHAVSAIGLAVIAVLMWAPDPGRLFKAEYDPKAYPAAAMKLLSPSQRIFTNDEWGDYLIYHLWPTGGKVYVDGRSDFYGSKFDKEYIELMRGKYDWEQTLSRYAVNTVVLPPGDGLASTIKESQHWRVIYDDGIAIVFQQVPPAGARGTSSTPQGSGQDSSHTAAHPATVTLGGHTKKSIGVKPL